MTDAIITANAQWTTHARPIVIVLLAMEAPAELYSALCDHHHGKDDHSKMLTRDYREAHGYIGTAREGLMDMLHGIRDNYHCDHAMSWPMGEVSEADGDAIEAFNQALDDGMISADAFIREVEGEVYG